MVDDVSALLPDYDNLPLGEVQHRIRSLDQDELRTVLEYERTHANRTAVVEVLDSRLDELAGGAEPTAGDQGPGVSPTREGSPVGPSTAAEEHTPQRHGQPGQTPRRGRP